MCLAARSYEGVPFRHLGRSRLGLDCGGLVACCLRDIGLEVVDLPVYRERCSLDILERALGDNMRRVSDPMDGDVLLFALEGAHCGIVDGNGFWHVLQDRSVLWTRASVWASSRVAVFGVG